MPVKKIIIIGSSSGLGKQLAILYSQQKHLIAVTGRRMELLEELKNQYPANIIAFHFDVTANDTQKQIEFIIEKLGGLDLLIYNAGYGDPSKELVPETERLTTLTNVNGFVEIVSYAFNYFVHQGYGQIALTSSLSALRGNSWTPAYSASKAFISNYAEGLSIKAYKLKKDITITDIKPGFIDTKMAKGNQQFWVASVCKAALQIIKAIEGKKRIVYITKRWWLIAQIVKWLPYSIYKRIA
jgi:short-subunit dehydrogenase